MRQFALLLCSLVGILVVACRAGDLSAVRTVYILPMAYGFDNHLASRLTSERVFQVAAKPASADAVVTERLGADFEKKLDELYPSAPPEAPAPTPAESSTEPAAPPASSPPLVTESEPIQRSSSFGRGKGTIFVVDVKTRTVIWSTFQRPKSQSSEDLDKAARDVVDQMKKHLKNLAEQSSSPPSQ